MRTGGKNIEKQYGGWFVMMEILASFKAYPEKTAGIWRRQQVNFTFFWSKHMIYDKLSHSICTFGRIFWLYLTLGARKSGTKWIGLKSLVKPGRVSTPSIVHKKTGLVGWRSWKNLCLLWMYSSIQKLGILV